MPTFCEDLTEEDAVLDFRTMMDPAIDLFHSRDKGELLGIEEPYDLQEIVEGSGLGPRDLAELPEDELVFTLKSNGFEPALINASMLIAEVKQALRT